jgi:MFS family permease
VNKLGTGFNRLWAASLSSNLADGLLRTAAPLLAISLTDDPVKISLIAAIVMLPWLFFAIPVGAVVDRVDRRKAIALSNAIRFLVAASVAVVISNNAMTIELLYLGAFIIGVCEVVSDTAAQAMIPQLLDESQYESGNSRLQMSETVVSQFVGSPTSGFLYAAAIFLPFAATSLGFLVAAILILFVPLQFKTDLNRKLADESNTREKFWPSLVFGLKYLHSDKKLFRLVMTTTAIGFTFSASNAVVSLYMVKDLGLAPAYFGVVLTIQGIGALLGGASATFWTKRYRRAMVMGVSMVFTGITVVLTGLSPNIFVFTAIATATGYLITVWNILLMSTYQTIIPNELFGRIHGARRTLVWGMMPLGSILGGFIARFGLAMPFLIGGTAATLLAIANYRFILTLGSDKAVVA